MKRLALVSIIDDDKAFQFSARKTLEATNKIGTILQFGDGEEALEYFVDNKEDASKIPDLIFLDLDMPYLDGWQFLDEFTTLQFKKEVIRIYICTSSTASYDKQRYLSYPSLKGYIIKPILKEDMYAVLDEELSLLN